MEEKHPRQSETHKQKQGLQLVRGLIWLQVLPRLCVSGELVVKRTAGWIHEIRILGLAHTACDRFAGDGAVLNTLGR